MKRSPNLAPWLLLPLVLAVSGCAATRYQREAQELQRQGRAEEAIKVLRKGIEEIPDDMVLRAEYYSRRTSYVDSMLAAAQGQRSAGRFDEAKTLYGKVLEVDSANARATDGIRNLGQDRRHAEANKAALEALKNSSPLRAQELIGSVLLENPDNSEALSIKRDLEELGAKRIASDLTLKLPDAQPVSLEFRDANVKSVFEVLARSTGINFILDKDVRPDLRTTVYLRESPVEDAVDLILQTSQLERKILNSNTVLIYPSTPEKLKIYQDLVVKAFYLQNADAKQVQASLKALLKTRDLVIDEKLNLLIMRDTPEAIRLADKLVAMHDLKEPEVMLEVEVLEVQRSRLTNLGIQWPNQLTLTPLSPSGGSIANLQDLRGINSGRIGISSTATTLNLRRDVSDVNILANPRIRVRNRETAKILIGDRLPVVTTNATATGLVSENIQYLDVGLKLDVQPDIRLRDEVAIKVALEVSSIVQQIRTPTGSLAYQIGTRNASTLLRLKDGETQILAGLINDQERSNGNRVPGLGELPGLNRLFGTQQDESLKTEIVLSITPRLIRNLDRPAAGQIEFWSGTEANLRSQPLFAQSNALVAAAPISTPTGSAVGAVPQISASPGAAVVLGRLPAPAVDAKNVAFSWQGPATGKVGEGVQVSLRVNADGTLRSLPLQIAFDTAAVQVASVIEGPYFKRGGGSTSFSSSIDTANGKIFVTAARSDIQGASGEEVVLILNLRPLSTKGIELSLSSAAPIVSTGVAPVVNLPPPLMLPIQP